MYKSPPVVKSHKPYMKKALIKINLISLLLFLFIISLIGQTKWYNPLEVDFPVVQNRGWSNEIGNSFQRLPKRAQDFVRSNVWNLAQNTAGMAIHFYTNSDKIEVRYGVSEAMAMNHMPSTGKSGVDLYAIDSDGRWLLLTDRYSFSDTIVYSFNDIIENKYHKRGYEYRLFLPLYNSVTWLEIGVSESAELSFIPLLKEKPILVYGTSIAQGACASRPGMAWTNILSRKLDYPVINLGYSGNGPLEKVMVDLISELDLSLIIYDCLPNMGNFTTNEIKNKTAYGVLAIREKSNTPILFTDHIGYLNDDIIGNTKEISERLNKATREVFDSLKMVGVANIYYLHKDSINFPRDGAVDYIHPNDMGMQVYAQAYEKVIRHILNMPMGEIITTKPVSQRREPDIYEWKKRHRAKLESIEDSAPVRVIMGNSITHYWNDEKDRENGSDSWKKYMEPNGYFNLGYGWDKIENLLWRVYHGELDGYSADEVVLMIGTNNISSNTEEDIVEGIQFLCNQIEIRQPKAKIKVVGILPRRGMEEKVKSINDQILIMTRNNNWLFTDVTEKLLKNNKIDESLFTDGLHPNEKGYSLIAPLIVN